MNGIISPWTIYWVTRLDGINTLLGVLLVIVAVYFIVCGVAAVIQTSDGEKDAPMWVSLTKRGAVALGIICVVGILTPSTKEVVAMYVIPTVANSADVQGAAKEAAKLPKNILEGANKLIEGWIAEQPKGVEKK